MTEALLRTLRTQVANDRVSEALETVDDLEAAFVSDRKRTEAIDTLAIAVRYRADVDSAAADAATKYLEAATDLEQRRVELNEAILGYIGEELPPKAVVGRIDATLDAYDTLAERRATLQDAAGGISVGVLLQLASIEGFRVPKGDSIAVATEVANLGSDETGSLEVTAESDDTVSIELSPTELEGLASDEEAIVGIDVGGVATGRTRVRISVEGAGTESTAFRVEVLDKADYVSETLSIAERLLTDVEGRMEGDGNDQSLQGLRNRFEEIVRRLEQILDHMENDDRGKGKSTDNRVNSVINRFESVVNTLENGDEPPLDARVRSEYVRSCRDSIDLLESAIAAAE